MDDLFFVRCCIDSSLLRHPNKKLCVLGTMDKIYPNRPGAYGFVIDQSAALALLPEPIREQVQFISICKKDSQDIDNDDR